MSKSKPKSRPTSLKVVITADMLDKRDEEAPEEKDDRLPHEVILDDINDRHLEEVARDERYEMRKYLLSWCCFMSNIIGVVLMAYSLGLTVLFYGRPTSIPGLVAAGFFFVPCLVWFFFLFCPSDRERAMRWAIHERRKVFRHIRDIRHRWSMGIDEEEYQEKKRLDAEEEEEYQRSRGRGSTRKSSAKDSTHEAGRNSSVRKSSVVDDSRRQSSFAGESGRKTSVADT